jgi:ABC-type lipoprotein release transport system permease subunit
MLVLILGVLCSAMLLVTVIISGKYMEMTHHAESLQRSVDIYTTRSARDWSNIMQLLEKNKELEKMWEFTKNDALSQRKLTETYKGLYRDAVKESLDLHVEKKSLREQLANKTQECVVIARDLAAYIEKFEGDN